MLVIFDWDGTLSDSTGKIVRCVQAAAAEMGLPALGDLQVKEIIGLSLFDAVARLYPDLDKQSVEQLSKFYSAHYLQDEVVPSFYDGALETVELLREEQFLLAVATGKSRAGLNRVLNLHGIEALFHSTRCADETASKPHPQMLSELLLEHDYTANHAVMIGDTEFDMAMAKAIDMPRIAVSYGAHHIDRLQCFDPKMSVDDLRAIVPWLRLQRELMC